MQYNVDTKMTGGVKHMIGYLALLRRTGMPGMPNAACIAEELMKMKAQRNSIRQPKG